MCVASCRKPACVLLACVLLVKDCWCMWCRPEADGKEGSRDNSRGGTPTKGSFSSAAGLSACLLLDHAPVTAMRKSPPHCNRRCTPHNNLHVCRLVPRQAHSRDFSLAFPATGLDLAAETPLSVLVLLSLLARHPAGRPQANERRKGNCTHRPAPAHTLQQELGRSFDAHPQPQAE